MLTRTIGLLVFTAVCPVLACSPKNATSAPSTTSAKLAKRAAESVYRFDFVLTSTEGANPPSNVSFTLTLPEYDDGQVFVGQNTPLVVTTADHEPVQSGPRTDIGTKVKARFETRGDAVLLSIALDATTSRPPTLQKFSTDTRALAQAGRSTVIAHLTSDTRQFTLSVTPTKLR
jgi:hypothetical protein